jgi:osmoprotectant transport system substrate-binding protein
VHDGFGLVLRADFAAEHELQTISDFSTFAVSKPEQVSFGMDSGFLEDEAGFSALSETYGMQIPEDRIIILEIGRLFDALAGNEVNAALCFAADGRIHGDDLVLMTDDRAFFMPQQPAVCLNRGIAEQYPEIDELLSKLRQSLDQEAMQELNYRITVRWQEAREAAESFLRDRNLIHGTAADAGH